MNDDDDQRRVRGSQVPEGTIIALMVGAEGQCGKADCESWRTVGFDVELSDELGESVARYIVCINHLPEFVDNMFFKSTGILESALPCGDPDCEIHGIEAAPELWEDYDDDEDDDDYDDWTPEH